MTAIETEDELTTFSHIYIAIASMFVAWFLVCVPSTTIVKKWGSGKYNLMIFTILIFTIVIPCIMVGTNCIDPISNNEDFAVTKLFSLSVLLIIATGYVILAPRYNSSMNLIATIVIIIGLIGNIAEACWVSYRSIGQPEFDNVTEIPQMNLIIFILGIVLSVTLLIRFFPGSGIRMNTDIGKGSAKLVSNLTIFFILGYTFWNLGYRIQLIENTAVLMFFLVSLVLPIITHYTKMGDWLQIRGLTLIFVIIVTLGIVPGEGTLFPAYNKQGYDQKTDLADTITKSEQNKSIKTILLVLGCVFTFLALAECLPRNIMPSGIKNLFEWSDSINNSVNKY